MPPPTQAKKPTAVSPSPPQQATTEPVSEPIQGSAIIVIHPGSMNLRLGRATDTFPHSLPHCIARRHKHPGSQQHYEDRWLARAENTETEFVDDIQKQTLLAAEDLVQSRPMSSGEYRQATSLPELAELNAGVKGERLQMPHSQTWSGMEHKPDFLIGHQALYVNPAECYNIHWPIQRGRLNLHSGPGGTHTAVLQDLEIIWGRAIQNYLCIPLKDLKLYKVVMLVPDAYCRRDIRDFVDILLSRLGFGGAFVIQESVCATFGAGVSCACVVDIGAQKTSISCVEDGVSQRATRLCMEFGGSDISRCFYWLLHQANFPIHCDLRNRMHALFLKDLKETCCHMDQDVESIETRKVEFKMPREKTIQYSVHMGDERMLAPMAVFYPDLFGLDSAHLCRVQEKYHSDPSDFLDDDYLIQTMSRHEQAARLLAARKKENAEAAQNQDLSAMDESQMDDDDTMDQPDPMAAEVTASGGKPTKKPWEEEEDCIDIRQGLMGIDQAILKSIEKCESEEIRRRMYSCILVVGGGLMFAGAQAWLQHLVWSQIPPQYQGPSDIEVMEVITRPKDMDPQVTCWKGAAVLCCLDTAQELWIRPKEWKKLGVRVLREKVPFPW